MNSSVDYLNNPWRPVKNRIIKSSSLSQQILEEGYAVLDFADAAQIKELNILYSNEHKLDIDGGGMFYSLYSQHIDYRKKINECISEILRPSVSALFQDYREVVNTFIVKFPGPKSEFFIHQDTTGLDEYRYSPLSIWLALDDIEKENGCMCLIPKSHHFFSPYRGISFGFPFDDIKDEVGQYLVPVPVKKGQAIIFDPRVVHNSLENQSDKPRVVSLTGLFPKEAEFIHCYLDGSKDETELNSINRMKISLLNIHTFWLIAPTDRQWERLFKKHHSVFHRWV